jgi:hypothetical protein
VLNDGQIQAVSPAGTGPVDVSVTAGATATLADGFTYPAPPTVTSVSPFYGTVAGGSPVTVTGVGFSTAPGATTIDLGTGALTGVTCATASLCTGFTAPEHHGVVTASATVGGLTGTGPAQFDYPGTPTVTSVSPGTGPYTGGTTVQVTGTGFIPGSGNTGINMGGSAEAIGVTCTLTVCTAVTPAGHGTVNVTADNLGLISAHRPPGDEFAYQMAIVTTSVPGAVVGAHYRAFLQAAGGNPPYTWSLAAGSAPLPAGLRLGPSSGAIVGTPTAPGSATVTVQASYDDGVSHTTRSATASLTVTVTAAPTPRVTGLNPHSGPKHGGNTVTVFGSALWGAAVHFGSVTVTGAVVNQAGTSLTVTAPAEPLGTVDVTVHTASGTSATSSADRYQFT